VRVYRTDAENKVGQELEKIFLDSSDPVEIRLENFPKYVRRQSLKRFLAMYELFKRVLPVKGSVVECGVFRGFGLMSWAKLSTILEPENLTRRIYGFDTFAGFPAVSDEDQRGAGKGRVGDLQASSYDELQELIAQGSGLLDMARPCGLGTADGPLGGLGNPGGKGGPCWRNQQEQ